MSKKPLKKSDLKTPWGKRTLSTKRSKGKKPIKNLFRIYCEGVNTEPEYFKAFPINPQTTKVFADGFGRQKTPLVKHVIKLLTEGHFLKGQKNYDSKRQLWVVFDYDYKGEARECEDYNTAIQLAKSKGIKVAYSNDAFEIWVLLHFQMLNAETHRDQLYNMISAHLEINYENAGKTKKGAKALYKLLEPFQDAAIANAERLYIDQNLLDSCRQNPITRVHYLVIELNKNKRK